METCRNKWDFCWLNTACFFRIKTPSREKIIPVEVILMARNQQQQPGQAQASKTNAQQVRQQNAQSAQGQSQQFEFASETDAQQVRQQNQQSAQRKQQASAGRQQQQ